MREKIKLVSSAKTGHFYTATKNKKISLEELRAFVSGLNSIYLQRKQRADKHHVHHSREYLDQIDGPEKDKRGLPAKCETCGEIRHEFVALLISIEPEQHEIKCDDCYVKEATNVGRKL